jgi:Xaa-Pro aminopeptidase
MTARMDQLREQFTNLGIDALLVSKFPNVRYLCGATGSACELLVTRNDAVLFSHFVDVTQNAESAHDVQHVQRVDPPTELVNAVRGRKLRRLGLEAHVLPQTTWTTYSTALADVACVPTSGVVEQLRWVKDTDELALIQRGMRINDIGMAYAQANARAGMTEAELAVGIEHSMRTAGADSLAFLIVQFGENAAKPHHRPGQRTLAPGDWILVDIGAVCDGYGSDTTRTFIFGTPSDRQRAIYETVRAAQLATLAATRAGVNGAAVHEASAAIIAEAGYAAYYGHGVGHGINEGPSAQPGATNVLQPGHVITIEPGIYIPAWGGVRIEDTVSITAHGYDNLATFPKTLTVIPS